jgi:acetoin utilization deacetylase AcuC-like enzyme
MTTALFSHPACLEHDTGPHHPERAARLQAIMTALDAPQFAALERHEAPLASIADIERVHPREHVVKVLAAVPKSGYASIDGDTIVSPGSGEAALRAAGAVIGAVDAVYGGSATNAFCAVRPPGHHAEPAEAMGFCLFNNVAIGARYARENYGARRVAIIDFDVHHGNGSQAVIENDANIFYASTHQSPLYPGTGHARETGLGNLVNAPLRPGSGGAEFRHAFSEIIFPALGHFAPDLLFISAGFDAHRDDPLANLQLDEGDYAWVTTQLVGFAQRYCHSRLVSSLEGGYDLDALARSVAVHVTALMAA